MEVALLGYDMMIFDTRQGLRNHILLTKMYCKGPFTKKVLEFGLLIIQCLSTSNNFQYFTGNGSLTCLIV